MIVCIGVLLILADIITTKEVNKKGNISNPTACCTTAEIIKYCKVPQNYAAAETLTTCGVFHKFRSIHWMMYFCCKTNWKGAEIGEQLEFGGGDWTAQQQKKNKPVKSMMKLSLLNTHLQSFISGRRCELFF